MVKFWSTSDRRSLRRLFAFGLVILGVGLLLDSLALVGLAVAFLAFWFVFIRATRRNVGEVEAGRLAGGRRRAGGRTLRRRDA